MSLLVRLLRSVLPSYAIDVFFVISFNGWGVSAIDSLDTMLLMGAREEFDRALHLVGQLNFAETVS